MSDRRRRLLLQAARASPFRPRAARSPTRGARGSAAAARSDHGRSLRVPDRLRRVEIGGPTAGSLMRVEPVCERTRIVGRPVAAVILGAAPGLGDGGRQAASERLQIEALAGVAGGAGAHAFSYRGILQQLDDVVAGRHPVDADSPLGQNGIDQVAGLAVTNDVFEGTPGRARRRARRTPAPRPVRGRSSRDGRSRG